MTNPLRRLKGSAGAAAGWATGSEVLQMAAGLITSIALGNLISLSGVALIGSGLAFHRLLQPLVNVGTSQLAVREVSLGVPLNRVSAALLTGTVGGALLGSGILAFLAWIFPLGVSVEVIALLGFSEGMALSTIGALVAFCEASKRAAIGTIVKAGAALVRLSVVLAAYLSGTSSPEVWVRWLAVGGVASTLLAVAVVGRVLRVRYGFRFWSRDDAGTGALLGVNTSAQTLLSDIDKALLNGMGFQADGGLYFVAYRLVSLSYVPVSALARTQLAEFFRLGRTDPAGALALTRRLSRIGGAVGVLAGAALLLVAPIIPVIWSEQFEGAVAITRALFWLPVIKSVQYFWANLLTGLNHQVSRLTALLSAGVLNLILNVLLIPRFGWEGAVAATAASEVLYLVGLWAAARRLMRRSGNWSRSF